MIGPSKLFGPQQRVDQVAGDDERDRPTKYKIEHWAISD
jgi:hypothetical protein